MQDVASGVDATNFKVVPDTFNNTTDEINRAFVPSKSINSRLEKKKIQKNAACVMGFGRIVKSHTPMSHTLRPIYK
jgi:hypothetical protein